MLVISTPETNEKKYKTKIKLEVIGIVQKPTCFPKQNI